MNNCFDGLRKNDGDWVAIDMESLEEVDRDSVLAELWKRNDQGVHYKQLII